MSDVELVIKIPEEIYKWVNDVNKFFDDYGISDFIDLVEKGTPLPKGHGPLKDSNEIIKAIEYEHNRNDRPFRMSQKYVIEHNVPTIVEADTESEE